MAKIRTKNQIVKDRKRISELYKNEIALRDIASILKMDLPTVMSDLSAITAEWRTQTIDDIGIAREKEIMKVETIQTEAMEQWKEWKGTDREDPRYLQIVLNCVDRVCRIKGLDAPTKIAPTDPTGEKPYEITDTEKIRSIVAFFEFHGVKLDIQGNGKALPMGSTKREAMDGDSVSGR